MERGKRERVKERSEVISGIYASFKWKKIQEKSRDFEPWNGTFEAGESCLGGVRGFWDFSTAAGVVAGAGGGLTVTTGATSEREREVGRGGREGRGRKGGIEGQGGRGNGEERDGESEQDNIHTLKS